MKYVPFITTIIDDEFGTQVHTEYDDETLFDTYDEAVDALDEIMDESDGTFGILGIENGKVVDQWNHGTAEENDEDDYYEDYDDLEIGFNPYMGCYDYDC